MAPYHTYLDLSPYHTYLDLSCPHLRLVLYPCLCFIGDDGSLDQNFTYGTIINHSRGLEVREPKCVKLTAR